jgi:hypothetical protein
LISNVRFIFCSCWWADWDSIYTEITKPGQLENKLSIANATINDGGNYTCSLDSFSFSIVVHFLKGEFFGDLICIQL